MKSLVLLLLAVISSPTVSGRTPLKDGWDDDDSMTLENSTPEITTEHTTPSLEESTSLPLAALLTLLPLPQEDQVVDNNKNGTKYDSELTTETSVDSSEVQQTTSNSNEDDTNDGSTSSTEEPDAVAIVELRKEPLTLEVIPLFKQKGGKMGLSPQDDSSGEMSTTESSEDDGGETTPQDDGGDLTPTPLSYMVPPRQEEESFWKKYPLRKDKVERQVEEEQDRTTIATDLDPQMISTTIPPQEEDEENFTTPRWEKELAEKLKRYLDKLAREIEITTTEQTTDATTTFAPQEEADNFDIFTTTETPTTEGPLLGEDDLKKMNMDDEMVPPPPPKPRIPETPILEPESYQVPVPEMDQVSPNSEASSQSEEQVMMTPPSPPRTFMVPPSPPMPEGDSEELIEQVPRRKLYTQSEVAPSAYFPYGKRYSGQLRDADYFYRPSPPSRQSPPQSSFYYNPNQYQQSYQPQFSNTRVTSGGYNSPSPFGGYNYNNANRNPYFRRDQSSYNFQRPSPSSFYNVNPVTTYDYNSPSSGPAIISGFSDGMEVPRYNSDSSEWQIYAPSYPYPNSNRRRTVPVQVQTQQRQNPFRFYYY